MQRKLPLLGSPLLGLVAAWLLLLGAPAAAQKLVDRDKPFNDPVQCIYTGGDPELLAKVGLVSLGPFPFGTGTSTDVDEFLTSNEIRWFESAHFRLGLGVGSYKVDAKERKKIRAELAPLHEALDTIPEKMTILDPWIRGILILDRMEAFYEEFLGIIGVKDEDFPSGKSLWDLTGTYMGEGPYLGMKDKYEILILPNEGALKAFLNEQFGLVATRSQRYHVIDRSTLIFVCHVRQGSNNKDTALHGHLIANQAHQFIHGFRHYSYESPIWFHSGFSHWAERRISPLYNSFDFSEGGEIRVSSKDDWTVPVRKLVVADSAPSMARLVTLRGYGEMTLDDHFTVWSMLDYISKVHPEFMGQFLWRVKGLKDEKGFPAGDRMLDAHRAAFEEDLGLSYLRFDEAWKAWVLENY